MRNLILLLLICPNVQAMSLQKTYLAKLQLAQTTHAVREVREQYSRLQRDKKICELQLNQNLVPSACYRWLRLQNAWRVLTVLDAKRLEEILDQTCQRTVQQDLLGSEEWLHTPLQDLSLNCRNNVKKSVELHRYRSNNLFSKSVGSDFEDVLTP